MFYHNINNSYEGGDLILHNKDDTLKIFFESSNCDACYGSFYNKLVDDDICDGGLHEQVNCNSDSNY